MDRGALITQMAKLIAGESVIDPMPPGPELRRRAEEALTRVEIYLGADVDEAKEMISKVLEDVT